MHRGREQSGWSLTVSSVRAFLRGELSQGFHEDNFQVGRCRLNPI
jgi:hypothetical protein